MNDFKWLSIAVAFMAFLCWVVTAPDRRAARHWWRRRGNGRDAPWGKVFLAFLPWCLLILAAGLWLWAIRHPEN